MHDAAVFFLVRTLTAPVVDGYALPLPVTHGIPVNRFVWAEGLSGTEASVSPEFSDPVVARENSRGNALAFGIAGANQQDAIGIGEVADKCANAAYVIGRDQSLFCKNVLQLR